MSAVHVPLGVELLKLDPDPRAPYQLTVDVFERDDQGDRVERWQVRGMWREQRERTLADLRVAAGGREDLAARLDELDREAASRMVDAHAWLLREQVRVLYGEEGVRLLDDADAS